MQLKKKALKGKEQIKAAAARGTPSSGSLSSVRSTPSSGSSSQLAGSCAKEDKTHSTSSSSAESGSISDDDGTKSNSGSPIHLPKRKKNKKLKKPRLGGKKEKGRCSSDSSF